MGGVGRGGGFVEWVSGVGEGVGGGYVGKKGG